MRRVFEYERRPPGALGGEKSRRGTDFPGSGRIPRGVFTLIPSRSSLPSVASILLDRRHTRSTVCLAVRCPRGGPSEKGIGSSDEGNDDEGLVDAQRIGVVMR